MRAEPKWWQFYQRYINWSYDRAELYAGIYKAIYGTGWIIETWYGYRAATPEEIMREVK